MKKRKFIVPAIAIIAAALLLEGFILKYVNDRNADRTSKVLLDRVITVLDKNDESRSELIESLKDDYIVRAKAVSYMIDADSAVEYDVDELQKIAKLMAVDEIHLFDDQGTIYSGSAPKYFGYNFDSGAQMEYFKPMLKNKSLTMCQDVTPNTAEGKKMMYAITWNEDGTKMIQVGIEPKRLLNEIKQNNISNVVARMPVYKGIEIIVADADTQVIEGATDSSKLGKKLEDVGISSDHVSADGATVTQIRMDGKHCRCMMRQNDNYIVFVTVEDSFYQQGGMIAIFIVGAYLVLASCCITYMFSKVMKERLEKEKLIYTSNTDELTRCLNRHAYENDMKKLNLSEEWVYISADLNGLKRANDSYGHMAGDELICAAADCMRDSFHEYGKVYRIGGDEFDESIVSYVKKTYNLAIGERTAEDVKISIGSTFKDDQEQNMQIRGRDLISGLPKTIEISSAEVRDALNEPINSIVDAIKSTLEKTPPELASDIMENGIMLTGGGALLRGLDKLVKQETGMPVQIAENPLDCVALGTGKSVEDQEIFEKVLMMNARK